MSYFIPRPRTLKIEKGAIDQVQWPAQATVRAALSPAELFGPSETHYPRTVLVGGNPATGFWNSNTGQGGFHSDVFLPPLMLSRELAEEVALAFDGNLLRATFTAQTLNHLLLMLGFKVFVRVDAITGELPNGVEFRHQLSQSQFPIQAMDEQRRAARVNQAIDFTQITAASEERYLLACIYYQQALRMESPHECTI